MSPRAPLVEVDTNCNLASFLNPKSTGGGVSTPREVFD